MVLDLSKFEDIDWDSPEQEDGNYQHCQRIGHLGPYPERVVDEILSEAPVELRMNVKTAEFAIVGPDRSAMMWVVLFDVSHKRGDFLRPVTGWPATANARQVWLKGHRVGGTVRTWLTGR